MTTKSLISVLLILSCFMLASSFDGFDNKNARFPVELASVASSAADDQDSFRSQPAAATLIKQETTDPSTTTSDTTTDGPITIPAPSWCNYVWTAIIGYWVGLWESFPPKQPQNDIILIGDSNLEYWDNSSYCGASCAHDLVPTAQNLGIGGTTCSGLYWFVPELLANYAEGTNAFVIHCGQNDMEFGGCDESTQQLVGVTADVAMESYKSIVRTILTTHAGPEAPQILYPGGALYPASPHLWSQFKRYDVLMREYAIVLAAQSPSRPPLVFIDADAVFSALGNPEWLYFEDGVHFSPAGYTMWAQWIETALHPSEADKDCVVWTNNECTVHGADVPRCVDQNVVVEQTALLLGLGELNCEKLRTKCDNFYVRAACPQTCNVTDHVNELQRIAHRIGFDQVKTCQDAVNYVSCEDKTYGDYLASLCPCTCNYRYFP